MAELRDYEKQCLGKRAHPTRRAAKRHLKSLLAKGADNGKRLRVYRCPHCGFFHVGHLPHDAERSRLAALVNRSRQIARSREQAVASGKKQPEVHP